MKFKRYLKHVEKRLNVPYPKRRDLLAEISSHLEELHEEGLKKGLDDEEAKTSAIRAMALDESLLADIEMVHAPSVRRALAILPPPLSVVVEHFSVGLTAALGLLTVIIKEEAMLNFFTDMGLFMYPLNLMGFAILFLAGERIFSLYIKKDHREENLKRRLLSLQFLAFTSIIIGALGSLLGFFQAFSSAEDISARFGGSFPIWEVSRIAISTTIWGLTLALVAVIAWYVFRSKGDRIADMRIQ